MRFRLALVVFALAAFPQPIAAQPSVDPANALQADAYRQGGEDWRGLQAWFGSQTGDRRVGVDYWAANRSVAGRASCAVAASGEKSEFIAGCEEAKRKLAPIDDRRRTSPEYRAGFSDAAKQLPIVAARTTTCPLQPQLVPGDPPQWTVPDECRGWGPTSATTKPAGFAPLGDGLDDLCGTATSPRTIALCSDRDLRAITVERQRAFDEARARLNPDQQKALLTDQSGWVKSYANACGLAEDTPPALPLAPRIKSCMARAGLERIAYLQTYAGAAPPATKSSSTNSEEIPKDEIAFCEITEQMQRAYNTFRDEHHAAWIGENRLRMDQLEQNEKQIFAKAKNDIFEFMKDKGFVLKGWVVTVREIGTLKENCHPNVAACIPIKVRPICSTSADIRFAVSAEPALIEMLARKKEGDRLIVNGTFIRRPSYPEASMSPDWPTSTENAFPRWHSGAFLSNPTVYAESTGK